MSPQEIALELTKAYFSKFSADRLMSHEFKGKNTLEAYTEAFNTFFKEASSDINKNIKDLN